LPSLGGGHVTVAPEPEPALALQDLEALSLEGFLKFLLRGGVHASRLLLSAAVVKYLSG
jgi:hypothetical protein